MNFTVASQSHLLLLSVLGGYHYHSLPCTVTISGEMSFTRSCHFRSLNNVIRNFAISALNRTVGNYVVRTVESESLHKRSAGPPKRLIPSPLLVWKPIRHLMRPAKGEGRM